MHAESIDTRRFAGARNTRDAYAARITGIGQTLLNNFLRQGLMAVSRRLYQRNGSAQYADIAFADAFHILGGGKLTHCGARATIRINGGLAYYAAVNL